MTHDPRTDRIAIEQSQSVLGYRRWARLNADQRRRLIDLMHSGMSDKDIFKAYRAVVEPERIAHIATQTALVVLGMLLALPWLLNETELLWK